jgi:hypothetical protein
LKVKSSVETQEIKSKVWIIMGWLNKAKKMKSKKTLFFIVAILFNMSVLCKAQKDIDFEIYLVDTITIDTPILLWFRGTIGESGILVSKNHFDFNQPKMSYQDFLVSNTGFTLWTCQQGSDIMYYFIRHGKKKELEVFYKQLRERFYEFQRALKTRPTEKGEHILEKNNGWEYFKVIPKRFLLFMVSGKVLSRWMGHDDIGLGDVDNVFFKVLIPISW